MNYHDYHPQKDHGKFHLEFVLQNSKLIQDKMVKVMVLLVQMMLLEEMVLLVKMMVVLVLVMMMLMVVVLVTMMLMVVVVLLLMKLMVLVPFPCHPFPFPPYHPFPLLFHLVVLIVFQTNDWNQL
jgi:hypothetical protein